MLQEGEKEVKDQQLQLDVVEGASDKDGSSSNASPQVGHGV